MQIRTFLTCERLLLLGLSLGGLIGVWHAFPMLNVVADEQYYVGAVLRALEAKSILPLPGDVPYGTLTFYLNYLLQLPFLVALFAWQGFHVSALKLFLVLHPEISYIVPRFASAAIACVTLWVYNRFLRTENVPLLQRFVVLAALFCTILPAVIFHTGKMWVLSITLVFASFLFLYQALKNNREREKETPWGSMFWSIVCAFAALANLPLTGVFLIPIPILLYVFRKDMERFRIIVRASLFGLGFLFGIFLINYQGIIPQITDIFTRYHPVTSGTILSIHSLLPFSSFLLHLEKVVVVFPLILMLLAFALGVRAIRNKLLFWLSAGYAALYFITIVFLVTWLTGTGDSLRHMFPFAFFFSGMIAALECGKMRRIFCAFCCIQIPVYVFVLYLLSVPTTFNLADNYIVGHYRQAHVLIYNDVAEITLPLNTESSLLLMDQFCGSKCQYLRATSTVHDFIPVVITFQSQLQKVNSKDFSSILWVSGQTLKNVCVGKPLATFQSGASDVNYVSLENNLGNYFLPDFWHLSRIGVNIYVYAISGSCFADLLAIKK